MRSLRARLFLLLISATLAVWSAAAVWTYASTRADVQRVLDRRLVEAAGMVASLVHDSSGAIRRPAPAARPEEAAYSRQLSCQIWTLDWRLVGRSASAPAAPLSAQGPGFSERLIQGERWRVYTLVEPRLGLRILVGDNLSVRRKLVGDVLTGLLLPAVVGLLALGVLIWSVIGRALVPIRRVAHELSTRDANETGPLGSVIHDAELQPLINAINGLFARLEQLRANERHFIASAAHELQTPLAGLRAHAQIALTTHDAALRDKSLTSIQTSVDRTSRLVQQLLDLSREEADAETRTRDWVSIGCAIDMLRDEFSSQLDGTGVELLIDAVAAAKQVCIDEAALLLALRNLIKNAIEHSPANGIVRIAVEEGEKYSRIAVIDEGPGIPQAELPSIRSRFIRGSRTRTAGAGLGLSIVELVLERAEARLELENLDQGGLRAAMAFPAKLIRAGSPDGVSLA
jgi:two-component system sensor histidine kinase QseC